MNLDGFALPVKKLKGTDPVETLDLSGKNLGVSSAVVIASVIGVKGALTQVLALSDTPKTAFSVTLTFAFALNGISAGHLKQRAVRPQ